MRREMLEKDMTGTKKLCEILWQAFGTIDEFVLEQEWVSEMGVKIYADVYHPVLRIIFEALGYVVHAEKITRQRHSFEQMRIRSFMKLGLKFMPFSWDELDQKPELCVRSIYEFLGRYGNPTSNGWMDLPVNEREIIRCAAAHVRPFSLSDVCGWLHMTPPPARRTLRSLVGKEWIEPVGGGPQRAYQFRVTETAIKLL